MTHAFFSWNQIHPQSNSGLAGFFVREECQLITVKDTELQTTIFQSREKHGFGQQPSVDISSNCCWGQAVLAVKAPPSGTSVVAKEKNTPLRRGDPAVITQHSLTDSVMSNSWTIHPTGQCVFWTEMSHENLTESSHPASFPRRHFPRGKVPIKHSCNGTVSQIQNSDLRQANWRGLFRKLVPRNQKSEQTILDQDPGQNKPM